MSDDIAEEDISNIFGTASFLHWKEVDLLREQVDHCHDRVVAAGREWEV